MACMHVYRCYDNHPECVMEACRQTLKDLQLDYLDLYLMHFPLSFVKTSRDKPVSERLLPR